MKNRDFRLDSLRVVAAFAVVWLHTSVVVVLTNPDIHNLAWWAGNFADAYTRWCVPIFVMVSGALVLSRSSEHDPIKFYRRRMGRLFFPLIFWSFLYLILSSYEHLSFDPYWLAKTVIKGQPYYHLWYLYMMAGLYLVTPFIRQFVLTSSANLINGFIVVCFVVASLETSVGILSENKSGTFLGLFFPFMGYFVAGYHIRNVSICISIRVLLVTTIVCGTLIALGTGLLLPVLGTRGWLVMYNYLNPFVIIMSLCIFSIAAKHRLGVENLANEKLKKVVTLLAPLTLGIYLVHPFWLKVLAHFGVNGLFVHPLLGIPFLSMVLFVLSVVSVQLLMNIPYLRSTVK